MTELWLGATETPERNSHRRPRRRAAREHDDELIVVDPDQRTIRWLALTYAAGYGDVERSALIDLGPDELADRLNWPAVS